MRKILIFLLILFSSLFFLLFHDKGNVYLKPYLASYLEKKLKQKISVKVEHLKIDFNYIELRAKLNEVTDFNAHGELSFLTQNLNLAYTLRSDNLENKIDINGTVKGLFDNMQIEGKGEALNTPIHYDLTLFEKPFQIEGVIESNLATLKISQANYNPNTKELTSNYFLLVPKASKLLFLSKHKLHGKLQIAGTFKTKNSQFYLTGNSKSLGGEIIFNFEKNKLNTHMNKVEISRLLYFLGIKHYVKGKLTAEIKLSDLKEPKGIFNLSTEDASSINRTFKNELDLNFKKGIYFSLTAKGNINPKSINMESKLDSDIFQYSSSDIIYDMASKKLNSSYLLKLPKLSRLTPITGKELRGKVSIKGIANHQNQLLITGTSKSLGGNIDFVLQAKKINAKLNSVSVEKLMRMLSYPELFKARLQGDFVYDLSASIGTFRSTLNQAELLNSYLIEVLKKIQDVDLSKERYNKTYFNANFNKSIIDIDFKAQSSTVLLYIPSGRINKLSNSINANYQVKVGKKNLEGTIKGNISKPKVTIDSSKFIQNQMMNVIPLHLDKNTLKEFRIPKEESKMMKSMMNGFFR